MDDLCTACLCSGRNLYFIGETEFYSLYSQILNEINAYDNVCVRVCWECRATLSRFQQFKTQIQQSYGELMMHLHQNTPKHTICKQPRLAVHKMAPTNYPELEVKAEHEYELSLMPMDHIKTETVELEHSEDTFVKGFEVEEKKEAKKGTHGISEEMRYKIIQLKEEGVSVTEISNDLGISRNSIYRWVERWNKERSLKNYVVFGRPRRTTMDEDSRIVQRARDDRFVNSSNLSTEFGVSRSTIRRRFRENGVHHRIPAKKPALTPRQKAQRLQFAQNYLNYNFDNVIFVDEKVFCLSSRGRLCLWRMSNTRYEEGNGLCNNGSGRITLGFWGWMSQDGPGELVEVGGRINGLRYKEVLDDVLLPTAQVFYPGQIIKFAQDNSSVHNCRVVRNYLSQTTDLEQIVFPPLSSDLNPIENLWGKMVQVWDNTQVRNTASLRKHVFDTWESLRGSDYCYNAVQSMRQRLSDVIIAEGGYTRF